MDAESLRRRLDALGDRLERVATRPHEVTAGWIGLASPVMRWLGWQPRFESAALRALAASVRALPAALPVGHVLAAVDELERDVRQAERGCVIHGRLPVAHLAWLQRAAAVLRHGILPALRDPATAAARLAAVDPITLVPPLTIAPDAPPAAPETPTAPEAPLPEPDAGGLADRARLVELQLAAIDRVIDAAREETSVLARRRRLLEAARRLLLDADAALRLDGEGVRARKRWLSEHIVELDRQQGAGVSDGVALVHQARTALARGERERLHATLVAMESCALAAGHGARVRRIREVLGRWTDGPTSSVAQGDTPAAIGASLDRSVTEVLGRPARDAIDASYAAARTSATALEGVDRETYRLALEYLAPGGEGKTRAAALAVDGCFDVGTPLAPVRVEEIEEHARLVTHPTREMLIVPARGPEDLPNAVITDPRTLVLDLAAGRLLARRHVLREQRRRERIRLAGELRLYVLDGSTSMLQHGGARARMRDAILVAELATLLARFELPKRYTRVALVYRYFTRRLRELQRVESAEQALAAIGEVLSHPRGGGTDIQKALTSSFRTIREARETDPELASAHVVLITDGEAPVDFAEVTRERERVGDLPVGVSVIALGQENPALRAIVARQRAHGERAFYHFVDDETLVELCEGGLARGRTLHLPHGAGGLPGVAAELAGLLEELDELGRARHRALRSADAAAVGRDRADALRELTGDAAPEVVRATEAARALAEAADRDRGALERRYARWFPPAPARASGGRDSGEGAEEADVDDADDDATLVVLATVAEVVAELGGSDLARQADAIDLLERLLPDAGLSPETWRGVCARPTPSVARGLRAVHAATGVDAPRHDTA